MSVHTVHIVHLVQQNAIRVHLLHYISKSIAFKWTLLLKFVSPPPLRWFWSARAAANLRDSMVKSQFVSHNVQNDFDRQLPTVSLLFGLPAASARAIAALILC
jgi:hypothetical protein